MRGGSHNDLWALWVLVYYHVCWMFLKYTLKVTNRSSLYITEMELAYQFKGAVFKSLATC